MMTPDNAARFLDRCEMPYDRAVLDQLAAACDGKIPTAEAGLTLGPPLDFGEFQLLVNLCLLAGYWRNIAKLDGLVDMADYDRLIADGAAPDEAYSAAPMPRGTGPVGLLNHDGPILIKGAGYKDQP